MATEVRLRELCAINNNIVTECDKMMQYLQTIQRKSEQAITFLNSLNTANILRRYSVTYEYLNKFYIKLLEQNCSFELYFLEMEELTSGNLLSAQHSLRDLTEEQSNFEREVSEFGGTSSIKSLFNSPKLVQHNEVNAVNKTFEAETNKVSNVTRARIRKMSAGSMRDVIIENSSISSESEVVNAPEIIVNTSYTADKAKFVKILTEENVAQHNLQSSSKPKSKKVQTLEKIKENHPEKGKNGLDLFSVSSFTSEIQQITDNHGETENIIEDKKEDDVHVLDIKNVIKHVNQKIKANELKSSVPIPDLRPTVVRKEIDNSSIPSIQSNLSSPKNEKVVNKKKNHTHAPAVNDNIQRNITIKRGAPPKEGELCCISSIDTPSSFYIHVIRDDTTFIDSLSQQIAEVSHSLKSFNNKKEARKYIKMYCVCYINTHSSWCRVEIINWLMEHEQMIEVRLIDYGLVCKVPLRNIREANQYFFVLPVMADKCRLAWVKPLNGMGEWSSDNITYFHKIVNESDRLFTVSYVEENGDQLIIDLQSNDIDSVAGLMISDGQGADDDESDDNKKWSNDFMRKQIIKSQGFTKEELNQAEEDQLEALMYDDEDAEEMYNPNLAVSHYNPKDESQICRIFLARGHCFKGKHCTFSHTPLNPDGWTTDRDAVFYDAFNQLDLPETGNDITVKIVNIVDLRTLYVVVKNIPECQNLIGMPVNNIRSLVKLMNDTEEMKFFKPLIIIPALGEIILVKYEKNWHRGKVVDVDEYAHKVEVEVLLVDFGIIRKFNMKQCRNILKKHLQLPFQVVLCTLCNVCMKDNLTESENEMGSDYLEMNVQNKKLKAKVMYSSHYLNVHLFTEDGLDVGEELIKAGIVNRCSSFTSISQKGLLVD